MIYYEHRDSYTPKDFKYVIIDTDAGCDDSHALILLDYFIKKTGKTLLGICCGDGNAPVQVVVKNVLITQAICNSSYPVYVGPSGNIAGQCFKDGFFGKDGLGETQQYFLEVLKDRINTNLVQKQKAYKFIADSALKYKDEIALICIGPLTNLGLAYLYENKIADCFTNLFVMGGSYSLAGMALFFQSQFNMSLDADAAHIMFSRFNNIVLIDFLTVSAVPPHLLVCLFKDMSTEKGRYINEIYKIMERKNPPQECVYCDAYAVINLFMPETIKGGRFARIWIEAKGSRTKGATMVDYFSPENQKCNAYIIEQFDIDLIRQVSLQAYK